MGGGRILTSLLIVMAGCHGEPESTATSAASAASPTTTAVPAQVPAAVAAPVTPTAPPQPVTPPDMVEIRGGLFLMGSRISEGSPEERPMHEVAVATFLFDRTEVTAAAYQACVKAGACSPMQGPSSLCNGPESGRKDHPANCIDFTQAEAFCSFAGKRLPSEREWEYAARGGSELRRFSWGEEVPDGERACYNHIGTCPVGSFPSGAFGLRDMSGNVWEWTSSFFGAYPDERASGTHRVYRGGSFSRRFPKWLRNALRNRYLPHEWSASLGVRCARTVSPVQCPQDTEARPASDPKLPPACERTRGVPACEPAMEWDGERCVLSVPGGVTAAAHVTPRATGDGQRAPDAQGQGAGAEAGEVAQTSAKTDAVVRTRTPAHDGDCKKNYPGRPAAFRFTGKTFHGRNPAIRAGNCVRRDMGEQWTSACCPGTP